MFTTQKLAPPVDVSETKTAEDITKKDLVDSVVLVEVVAYDPAAQTVHGNSPQADVKLLVVTGPMAGQEREEWRTFGLLAKQLDKLGKGVHAVKIVSGPTKNGQGQWYGVDSDLTKAERNKAEKALAVAGAGDEEAPF